MFVHASTVDPAQQIETMTTPKKHDSTGESHPPKKIPKKSTERVPSKAKTRPATDSIRR